MNGLAIEVPGEASPLNEVGVERNLRAATSNDVTQIQSGTKQLEYWETDEGYYSTLQNVFLRRELPPEVRMLSMIQLKNGIDKYWRKSASNAIRTPERTKIRERLISGSLEEPIDRLASLSSIVAAKVARYEFPSQWPDLFKDLITSLNDSANPNAPASQLQRSLLIIHHVVKELATVKLTRNRQAFTLAVPGLLDTLRRIYSFKVQQWQSQVSGGMSVEVTKAMNASEQCLKILRRLVVSSHDFPHSQDQVKDLWQDTAGHVQLYLQMYQNTDLQNAYRISASQHAKQLSKMHVNLAKDHAVSFALLPNTPDLVRYYWSTARQFRQRQLSAGDEIDDDETDVLDAFSLRAILLLRACFKEAFNLMQPLKYRNSDRKQEPAEARKVFTDNLLTHAFVQDLFQSIVSNFFIYVQSDIEEWVSEPEEWDMKLEGDEDAYERSVRAASERLFLDITLHHKDLVIEPLMQTANTVATSDNQPLMKDAIYSAIGIAAPILEKRFDFNNFLRTTIISDLQQQDAMYSIVRRRIAITLARWIVVDIAAENQPLVFDIFNMLLDPDAPLNTQTVRITAGKRLQDTVDAIFFSQEAFAPYMTSIMNRILDLIRSVSMAETKLALLHTVSTIILQMGSAVNPFAEQIVNILQSLWAEATDNMMKTVLVNILRKLVQAMKAASLPLHSVMLPIIKATLEPDSDLKIYLLDDALLLWHAILEHTPAPASSDLLSLTHHLLPLYETDDSLDIANRLTRSYIFLAPEALLHDSLRPHLFASFPPLFSVRRDAVRDGAARNLELLIRSADALGGEQAIRVITEGLVQAGVLPHILESLHQNWEAHESTGPNKKGVPNDWKNETMYLCILARIILPSTEIALGAINAFALSKGLSLDTLMDRLLAEAFGHMDAVGMPTESKLICMALTKLLETGQGWILGRLQDLMGLWTSLVGELRDVEAENGVEDTLVHPAPTEASSISIDIPEAARHSATTYTDPVHTIPLGQFVRHHLQSAIARCGGEQQFREQWLVNVDEDVVKGFGELGVM